MSRGYPNPLGTEMRYNFSSPLNIGRVTCKYIKVGDENGEGKIRPHHTPLSCLNTTFLHILK